MQTTTSNATHAARGGNHDEIKSNYEYRNFEVCYWLLPLDTDYSRTPQRILCGEFSGMAME
jgi:hypothetical protein